MSPSKKTAKSFPKQAIVLAAGLGTRLRPLTYEIPKPVLPVGGIPILLFNLYILKNSGIKNITINLHHRPEKIRQALRESKKLGIKIQFSQENTILGTAGGIDRALRKMAPKSTFVLNGDILFDLDLKAMFRKHQSSGALATLACVSPKKAKVDSFVEFDGGGKIWKVAGGPESKNGIPKKLNKGIFSGAHLLEPQLFKNYPRGSKGCIVRQVYQPALKKHSRLQAFSHTDEWWDLGSIPELKRVDGLLWKNKVSPRMHQLWKEVYDWSRPLFR